MKGFIKICIFFFYAFSGTAFGQLPGVFHINKLSAKDTLVTGWKMFAGDNPQFADPKYDDSQWQPVDMQQDMQDFSPLRKAGIIWIRIKIKADSTIVNDLAAHIVQYSASEVYINGNLLIKYGTIEKDPGKVIAFLPLPLPFPIHLQPDVSNVVAVRLAYEPGVPYISPVNATLPPFALHLNNYRAAIANYNEFTYNRNIYVIIYSISSGTLLIIGIIYLIYFLYDRRQRVHLFYALTTLSLALNALPIEVWGAQRFGAIAYPLWIFLFENVANTAGMLFMLMTIYTLFQYKSRLVFWMLVFLGAIMCILMYYYGTIFYDALSTYFPILCLLQAIVVIMMAVRQKKKDAVIILGGVIMYLFFAVAGTLFITDSVSGQFLWYVGQMFFPIGMSFYLGIQNSITNKNLRQTLVEVRALSEKNLVQEQEKQQLLAGQNELLEQKVNERTEALNNSLQDLKSTQSQLIQSEKMASLGELTAGIAHEIQNPLNYVNNFSEVNKELNSELVEELGKGNTEEVIVLANDIKENEEKINHHGKRADAIVKGMLQHSQSSSGKKEPTDINKLADEYLRLAYHGLRAKDKSFNATMKTDFDESLSADEAGIGNINIIPQDIGRVILNLITNAFYVVNEKKNSGVENYEPTVSVSTKKINGKVEIMIADNGNGIHQKILDKIFQPFFTTKPTGQGTGLGLSLAYDIVKAHGGELKVEAKEGEGATFTLILPISL